MTFEELNLNIPLLNALKEMGYQTPTPVQEKVFSVVMSGKDVVGIAQTGTGKTIAYLLPILRQLKYSDQKHPRILVVVPTRELVMQVIGELEGLCKYMNVRYAGVFGGVNINPQKEVIHQGLDIIVGTPGRLVDLALSGVLRLKAIQKLVIDEMDELLHQGFRPQVVSIMDLLPAKRQNLMFSATMTEDVDNITQQFFYNPQKVEVAVSGTPLAKITQRGYYVPNFYTKLNLLEYLLTQNEELSKVLVFAESKSMADRIYENLINRIPGKIDVIHSNKSQNYRFDALNKLEVGSIKVLVATDLVARGVDVKNISHVINFDTPQIPEDYIHRMGRTGRANQTGSSIIFVNEMEEIYLSEIERMMNMNLEMETLPEEVEVSSIFLDGERPTIEDKSYLKVPLPKPSGRAFHEKKEKNKKVNLGGSYRRMIKLKYKKPIKKGGKKK